MPDFGELFRLSVNPLELVVRGTLLYLGLVLLFRFVLRRDLGQMGVADLLFVVIVADAAQNGLAGQYRSISDAAVLLGTLAFWNVAIDLASYRFKPLRQFFMAPTVELVRDGRVLRRNLRREWITFDELMGKLRQKGIEDVADVRLAVLEPDGELTVLKHEGRRRPTDPAKGSASDHHVG